LSLLHCIKLGNDGYCLWGQLEFACNKPRGSLAAACNRRHNRLQQTKNMTVNIVSEMNFSALRSLAWLHTVSATILMIQAFHRALQIRASLGTCIWDPIYQGNQKHNASHYFMCLDSFSACPIYRLNRPILQATPGRTGCYLHPGFPGELGWRCPCSRSGELANRCLLACLWSQKMAIESTWHLLSAIKHTSWQSQSTVWLLQNRISEALCGKPVGDARLSIAGHSSSNNVTHAGN